MWPSRRQKQVTCLACGCTTARDDAREYDKYGDRWNREEKTFEHLCKPCHTHLCQHPRDDLEELLIAANAGTTTHSTFLSAYVEQVENRYGPLEEQ